MGLRLKICLLQANQSYEQPDPMAHIKETQQSKLKKTKEKKEKEKKQSETEKEPEGTWSSGPRHHRRGRWWPRRKDVGLRFRTSDDHRRKSATTFWQIQSSPSICYFLCFFFCGFLTLCSLTLSSTFMGVSMRNGSKRRGINRWEREKGRGIEWGAQSGHEDRYDEGASVMLSQPCVSNVIWMSAVHVRLRFWQSQSPPLPPSHNNNPNPYRECGLHLQCSPADAWTRGTETS